MKSLELNFSPGPKPTATEAEKRDVALDAIELFRGAAVRLAREAADEVYRAKGQVSSTDVFAKMREHGHGPLLASVDRRFMGAVFRKGWRQVGTERTGSHKRSVPIWSR